MKRAELEHLLRAAAAIANEQEFVVIGSQAILGQFPDAPESLLVSIAADLYPRHAPERSDLVGAAIGELSMFHQTYGYYAHGVDHTTATLPDGWAQRLVPIENANTGGAVGWCLEVHDLAVSKLVAGRPQDVRFLQGLSQEGMVDRTVLEAQLSSVRVPPDRLRHAQDLLRRL